MIAVGRNLMMSDSNKQMAEYNTILRCKVGSVAYGLAVEGSDRDEKGVCIEPFSVFCRLQGEFEQYEYRDAAERTGIRDAKSEDGDLDLTIYGLRKYLRLATYGNPNIVELLFLSGDAIISITDLGRALQGMYPRIISRQCGRRYLGYIEAQKQRLLGERGQMRVTRTDLIETYGYDTKYASHMIRLGYQGIELLETGKLVLPMESGRKATLDVKQGKYTLNEVLQLNGDLEQTIKDLIKESPIRDTPDMVSVEQDMQYMYEQYWRR